MRIRNVHDRDAAALLAIHQQITPHRHRTAREIRSLLDAAAFAQVAEMNGQVVGYAAAMPVPGLTTVADLTGLVAPAHQRQGVGRALLQALVSGLRPQGIHQLTFSLSDTHSPEALFLLNNGFTLHHEEWELVRVGQPQPPLPNWPPDFTLRQLTRDAAATTFRRLYDASFGPHPWYQPYTDSELSSLFPQQGVPRFLFKGDEPIGFFWCWPSAKDQGVIEPVGIAAAYQGQGLGRQLVLAALRELERRAVSQVKIGAWQSNAAAIHLYQSLGFHHTHTITHLQLTIDD